jgi:hypothetical protein
MLRPTTWNRLVPLAFALVSAGTTIACRPPAAPAPRMVSLRFAGTPENASVFVDDILVGPLDVVKARGIAVPAGIHHITVQAEGHFADDRVIDAKAPEAAPAAATPVVLTFALKKLPE